MFLNSCREGQPKQIIFFKVFSCIFIQLHLQLIKERGDTFACSVIDLIYGSESGL